MQRRPITVQSAMQSQVHHQPILQKIPCRNASPGVQRSTSLPFVRTLISSGSVHASMVNVSADNTNLLNISAVLQNSEGNSMAHGASPCICADHQRQSQHNQSQGLTISESSYHQQLQPQVRRQFRMENVAGSFQTHTGRGQVQKQQELEHLQPSQPPVYQQPQQALHIHHNLLPLQRQPHMMELRLSTVNIQHDQSINHQRNDSGVQHNGQMPGNRCGNSSMQQDEVALRRQAQHSSLALFPAQGQLSQPGNLRQPPIPPQQQMQVMQHRLQTSALDRVSTKEHASVKEDGNVEVFAKVQHLKNKYCSYMRVIHRSASSQLQSSEALSQQPNLGHLEKLEDVKELANYICLFLSIPISSMNKAYEQQLGMIERRIIGFINYCRRLLSSPRGQLPSNVHSMHQTSLPQCAPSYVQMQTTQDERKPQLQSMNSPDTVTTLHQNNGTSLQNDSVSSSSQPAIAQQNNMHVQRQPAELLNKEIHRQMNEVKNVKSNLGTSVEISQNKMKINSKTMEGSDMKSEALQQHQPGGHSSSYYHHHSILGILIPTSSPKLQSMTPHTDQLNQPGSPTKAGTALHDRNSPSIPSVVPKSTSVSQSHKLRDSDKLICDAPSLSSDENDENQHITGVTEPAKSCVRSTSPFAESNNLKDTQYNVSASISDKSSVAEQPLQRLLKAVNSMSAKALSASVRDIRSVVSMTDRIAGSTAAIGEDLEPMTISDLQARYFTNMDESLGRRKRKLGTTQMPLDIVTLACGTNVSFELDESYLDSVATSRRKRPRIAVNHALMEEIMEINQQLLDTVVDISNEDTNTTATEGGEGTIVTCSFSVVTVNPHLYASTLVSLIPPLRLLVPANYPNCSPVLLDKLPLGVSGFGSEDVSVKAKSKLNEYLERVLRAQEGLTIGEIARSWDFCSRSVVLEYALQNGGGNFSSKYGSW